MEPYARDRPTTRHKQHKTRGSVMQSAQAISGFEEVASNPANVRRAVVAATIGTVIEWYDYALYGAASGLIINKLFFPSLSPVNGVLPAFPTFARGFFMPPVPPITTSHF